MKTNKLILNIIIAIFFGLLSFHSNADNHSVKNKTKYSKKVKKAKKAKKNKKAARKNKKATQPKKAKKPAPPAEENSDMGPDSDTFGEDF